MGKHSRQEFERLINIRLSQLTKESNPYVWSHCQTELSKKKIKSAIIKLILNEGVADISAAIGQMENQLNQSND